MSKLLVLERNTLDHILVFKKSLKKRLHEKYKRTIYKISLHLGKTV